MKKFLLSALSVVTVAALAITGTIAWLQDDDSDVNVMTVGNVSIRQNEEQRVDPAKNGTLTEADVEAFKQAKPIYPYVDVNLNGAMRDDYEEITFPDGNTYKLFIGDNAIDKLVSVTNTGKSDAYVRTIIALEAPTDKIDLSVASQKGWTIDGAASTHSIEVDGVKYDLLVCVYQNVLKPGETTPYSLLQILIDGTATNEDCAAYGDTYDVLVLSQAVQVAGFDDAQTALNTAFGEVNAATAAEWFGGDEFTVPVVPPADAVKVDSTTTFAEFADLLANGKNILVTENVDLTDKASGNTYLTVNDDAAIYASEGAVISFNETALINGGGSITVYSGALQTSYELCVTGDATLIIEGGEYSFGAFSATGNGKIVVNGGTLNCRGTYAGVLGISFAENGQLIVNDGTLNMYQPFNLNANRCDAAYVEINGGSIHLLNGADKLFAVRNIMDKDRTSGVLRGSSIKITGGVFTTTYELDSTGDANAFIRNEDGSADTTRVLEFNTYNSAKQYDCEVTGGTFYGSWMRTGETGGDGTEVCANTIAGFVADGYQIIGDEVNGYVVSAK